MIFHLWFDVWLKNKFSGVKFLAAFESNSTGSPLT